MYSHRIPAVASVRIHTVGVAAISVECAGPGRRRSTTCDRSLESVAPEKNAQLSSLIAEVRSQTDAFVFLSGGASRMREDHQQQLLGMFEALALIAKGGRRIAVGDGGTQAGIMEAAGRARRASSYAFPLIGVAPAREIPPRGKTPVDPNHSHVIAVDNPSAPAKDEWESLTSTMVLALCCVGRRTPVRHDSRQRRRYYADGGGIERPRRAPHHSDRGHRPRGRCPRIVVAEDAGLGAGTCQPQRKR